MTITAPHSLPRGSGVVDVAVVGAGAVGLVLSIALARAGLDVVSVGTVAGPQAGRTVALLDGSVRMLAGLDLWPSLREAAAPLRRLRIVDATPSLFRPPPVTFAATALGLDAFGYNVSNDTLVGTLQQAAAAEPRLRRLPAMAAGLHHAPDHVVLQGHDGPLARCRLVIAADGARSALRATAGIAAREHAYPQLALTAVLNHTASHRDTSTEFHTRQGPFTLVPMAGTAEAPHRSSMVWVMLPAEADRRSAAGAAALQRDIEQQSRGLLGAVALGGAVGRFPIRMVTAERLVGSRLALVGEAAHALPPIGAQGLNLSLRDAATLVDILGDAHADGRDVGEAGVLKTYGRARGGDIALRGTAVDALNRALLNASWPADALRGFGLGALAAIRPLREAVMRQGLRPGHALPRLMRASLPEA